MWTYTLPSERTIEILNEAGYPLFTGAHGCARTLRAMADYRALRERLLRPLEHCKSQTSSRTKVAAPLAASPSVLCEYQSTSALAAYGIGADNAGELAHSRDEAAAQAWRSDDRWRSRSNPRISRTRPRLAELL